MTSVFSYILTLGLFVCTAGNATTIAREPLEDVFRRSDFVAIVHVIEGQAIQPLEDECGSIYKGQVIKLIKGTKETVVKFGHFDGLMMGQRYLVFLTNPDNEYRSLSSTNSISMGLEAERVSKCRAKWTGKKVMQGIHGAMSMEEVILEDTVDAVKVPTRFIDLPRSFKITPFTPPVAEDYYTEPVWVLESEIIKLLESYAKERRESNK